MQYEIRFDFYLTREFDTKLFVANIDFLKIAANTSFPSIVNIWEAFSYV